MIRLTKSALPPILAQNRDAWTQVLIDHLNAGTEPTNHEKTRYRHADIKASLVEETHGKCAYCESKVKHITYGDIEHIVPKSTDNAKTFEWSNLTLACDQCNTNKGTHFGNHEDFVDPYAVEPSDHLHFAGASVFGRPGSHAGLTTESTLQLNRVELLERRSERLNCVNRQLHLLCEVSDEHMKRVIRNDILNHELADDKEYAAMTRGFVHDQLKRIDSKTVT